MSVWVIASVGITAQMLCWTIIAIIYIEETKMDVKHLVGTLWDLALAWLGIDVEHRR